MVLIVSGWIRQNPRTRTHPAQQERSNRREVPQRGGLKGDSHCTLSRDSQRWTRGEAVPFSPPQGAMGRVALTLNKAGKRKRNLPLVEFHHGTTGQNLHALVPQMYIITVGQETLSYGFSLTWCQTIALPSTWQKETIVMSRGRHFHPRPQGLYTNDLSLSTISSFEDHQTHQKGGHH